MPIDARLATSTVLPAQTYRWSELDVLRYHLAIGAGADPVNPAELRYTYERDLRVLPTFAALAPSAGMFDPPALLFPGIHVDLTRVLHVGQEIELDAPLPGAATVTLQRRIVDVFDKGSAAVIVHETTAFDQSHQRLYRCRCTLFARGEGGFGGARGPSARDELPDRVADLELTVPTLPQQALLYRLCGDRNPLHADPEFATASGFPRPILHGLASLGIATKAVVDAERIEDVTAVHTRFTGVLYPGETIRVRCWRGTGAAGAIAFAATAVDRGDAPVLTATLIQPKASHSGRSSA